MTKQDEAYLEYAVTEAVYEMFLNSETDSKLSEITIKLKNINKL